MNIQYKNSKSSCF